MSLWLWIMLGAVVLAAVLAGVTHYRANRSAFGAVQAGLEVFIGKLAASGQPELANELGKTVGDRVSKAGKLAKIVNDALHRKTKRVVAEEGTDARALIAEAFRKRERTVQP